MVVECRYLPVEFTVKEVVRNSLANHAETPLRSTGRIVKVSIRLCLNKSTFLAPITAQITRDSFTASHKIIFDLIGGCYRGDHY